MLRAGSCTPEGTSWSFGVQDATLIFFQVLPVLGCNIKSQEVTASWIFFFFPSVTEDSSSSGTLINMWMTYLFNLSVSIVYQLELCIYNQVISPLPQETLTTTLMQGKEESSVSPLFSNLSNKFFLWPFNYRHRWLISSSVIALSTVLHGVSIARRVLLLFLFAVSMFLIYCMVYIVFFLYSWKLL